MLANWITLSRLPLLVVTVLLLYRGSPEARLVGAGLLFVGLMLDTVDGIVARRTGQTSLFGSVLDIAADRVYELVLWVCFAQLGMIPVAIPLIVIGRTTLSDGLRSVGVARGTAPFAQHGTALGRFLVGSAPMRVGYSASKTVTFCGLALVQALAGPSETISAATLQPMLSALQVVAWIAVGLCVIRGIPVLGHALRQLRTAAGGAPGRAALTATMPRARPAS